jgi:hypothetical protein
MPPGWKDGRCEGSGQGAKQGVEGIGGQGGREGSVTTAEGEAAAAPLAYGP